MNLGRRKLRLAAVAVAAVALLATACSSSGSSNSSSTSTSGTPVFGGTLRWVASGDVDHLDPMPAYYTATAILEHAYTRQLVTYPSSNNFQTGTTIVPDVATVVPTMANGGVTPDGPPPPLPPPSRVRWNTHPPPAAGGGA